MTAPQLTVYADGASFPAGELAPLFKGCGFIRGVCLGSGREPTKVALFPVDGDARVISAVARRGNPFVPRSIIVSRRRICDILSVRAFTQIRNSIVGSYPVNVIDGAIRPSTITNTPCQTMENYPLPINYYSEITAVVDAVHKITRLITTLPAGTGAHKAERARDGIVADIFINFLQRDSGDTYSTAKTRRFTTVLHSAFCKINGIAERFGQGIFKIFDRRKQLPQRPPNRRRFGNFCYYVISHSEVHSRPWSGTVEALQRLPSRFLYQNSARA